MRVVCLTVACSAVLTGCGGGFNPVGAVGDILFGSEEPTIAEISAIDADPTVAVTPDGSILVPGLQTVRPEAALRGLILRAVAITPTQGYYGAALIPANRGEPDEDGVITYAFRAFAPDEQGPVGAPTTRQLLAAAFIPDTLLDEVQSFRIIADGNTVTLRR